MALDLLCDTSHPFSDRELTTLFAGGFKAKLVFMTLPFRAKILSIFWLVGNQYSTLDQWFPYRVADPLLTLPLDVQLSCVT